MANKVLTNILDIRIDNFDRQDAKCSRFNIDKENFENDHHKVNTSRYLKLHTSLIGEESPEIIDLPVSYISDPAKTYRYDWLFGISCFHQKDKMIFWDWKSKLSEENTIKLQLVFETVTDQTGIDGSDIFVQIIGANLLCLNPSKSTGSWFERNRENISTSLKSLANTSKDYSKIASDVFSTANMLTNFVDSDDNGKNWYLYKYLDQLKNNYAVEWHINRKVLDQYGPMIQGSLIVSFHGSVSHNKKLRLHIRPCLNFIENSDMCFISPYDQLNINHFIEITPRFTV